ncbi:MAG: hypothetical protein ACRDNO_02615 [Trebonia sp.]
MSVHVPAEMPVGRAVRYAARSDGATCTTNAAVSSVPRATRPPALPTAASAAAHAPIRATERGSGRCQPVSMTVSAPASSVTEQEGTRALQSRDRAK